MEWNEIEQNANGMAWNEITKRNGMECTVLSRMRMECENRILRKECKVEC